MSEKREPVHWTGNHRTPDSDRWIPDSSHGPAIFLYWPRQVGLRCLGCLQMPGMGGGAQDARAWNATSLCSGPIASWCSACTGIHDLNTEAEPIVKRTEFQKLCLDAIFGQASSGWRIWTNYLYFQFYNCSGAPLSWALSEEESPDEDRLMFKSQ